MPKAIMSKQKFINQWLRHFAKSIDKKDIEKCFVNDFIWHIFSYGLLAEGSFLAGNDARAAYDEAHKSDCIFCDMFGQNGVTDKTADIYGSAESIDRNVKELYVVAKDYSWTYIKTHEGDLCGPYFMRVKE